MKKLLSLCLCAALVLALSIPALAASSESWGEYTMENDGYGYLTANFPAVFPADIVEAEGTQVVLDKAEAILLTVTDTEAQTMISAFASKPVAWSGIARMGIPNVTEGTPVSAEDIFTGFDAEAITEALSELALLARAEGCNALRLVGLDAFPEVLAAAAQTLFEETMNANGVIALEDTATASDEPSGEPSADADAQARELLCAIGAAGYLQYMQVSRDGLAALDSSAPPVIEVEALAYAAPVELGDYAIILPEGGIKAGETVQIVAMTPADVMSAMLRDENGENLPIDDMLKENLGEGMRFTYTLRFDAAGSVPIELYTMSTAGWSDAPAASVTAEVK